MVKMGKVDPEHDHYIHKMEQAITEYNLRAMKYETVNFNKKDDIFEEKNIEEDIIEEDIEEDYLDTPMSQ